MHNQADCLLTFCVGTLKISVCRCHFFQPNPPLGRCLTATAIHGLAIAIQVLLLYQQHAVVIYYNTSTPSHSS